MLTQPMLLADLAPNPGYTSNFSYCLKVTNLQQHPDYSLFVKVRSENPNLPIPPQILLQANTCVPIRGYRPIVTITALAKAKIRPEDLATVEGQWVLRNPRLQTAQIQGTPEIEPPSRLPILYQEQQVEDSYQIQAIAPTSLQLAFVQRSPQIPSMLNLTLIPLIGMAVIGGLVWQRKRRRQVNP